MVAQFSIKLIGTERVHLTLIRLCAEASVPHLFRILITIRRILNKRRLRNEKSIKETGLSRFKFFNLISKEFVFSNALLIDY